MKKYVPIAVTIVYFAFTYVLFQFGPLDWKGRNDNLLWLYLFITNIFLIFGYVLAIKSRPRKNYYNVISVDLGIRMLKYTLIINSIFLVLNLYFYTNASIFNPVEIFNQLKVALDNSSSFYLSKFSDNNQIPSFYTMTLTLISPLLWISVPFGLYHYKKLEKSYKIILILNILLEVIRWIMLGTNKGVIDVILILIIVFFLKMTLKGDYSIKPRNRSLLLTFSVVVIILGIIFFSNNISDRVNDNFNTISIVTNNTAIDNENIFFTILPAKLHAPILYITQYLTQGYQGLSYALSYDFVPMFGLGGSYFLIENINQVVGIDLYTYTYQERISDTGWDSYLNWHTAYTALANNYSFPGVILLMLVVGFMLGITYKEVIIDNNQVSFILFILICMFIFYIPMNNQIFLSPFTFMTFWVFTGLRYINFSGFFVRLRWGAK